MKKFYFKVDANNIITDAIDYPYNGYIEVELPDTHLPAGINGGWFKLENGQIVEYPELRPKDPEVEQLKQVVADLEAAVVAILGGAV